MRDSKKNDRKNLIFNAAIKLFGEFGYEKTTVLNISEKTGMATGTLYNYFKSKGDLLLSIIESRSVSYLEKLDDITKKNKDIFMALSLFIDIYLESFSTYDRNIWREFMAHALSHEPELIKHIQKIDEPYIKKLGEMICKLSKSGNNSDVEDAVLTIYSSSMFWILSYISDDTMTSGFLKNQIFKSASLIIRSVTGKWRTK